MKVSGCGTARAYGVPPARRRRAHWRIAARGGGDARDSLREAKFTERELSGVSTPLLGEAT